MGASFSLVGPRDENAVQRASGLIQKSKTSHFHISLGNYSIAIVTFAVLFQFRN